MPGRQDNDKVMFDFDSEEEYVAFSRRVDRLYGEGSYREVGKHTNNVVVALPGNEEDFRLAREGNYEAVTDPEHQARREAEALKEIRRAVGEPPREMTAGSASVGKGAEGLPQQFIEILVGLGGVYGGFRALYEIGVYTVKVLRHLYEKYSEGPLLNKGGVVAVCAVDLVDNRSVEDAGFLSAVEAGEDHRWTPSLDGQDLYYVTFTDTKGLGHLYVVNSLGAILHYVEFPMMHSFEIKPSLPDVGDEEAHMPDTAQ